MKKNKDSSKVPERVKKIFGVGHYNTLYYVSDNLIYTDLARAEKSNKKFKTYIKNGKNSK